MDNRFNGECLCILFLYLCKMKESLHIHRVHESKLQPIPMVGEGVRAGFPSPAQDYIEGSIDLNKELVKHPASTFYVRVAGDSMIDAGINEGDILVIDKSLEPHDGDMAVCFLNGEFTLKYICIKDTGLWLEPANKAYPLIPVGEDEDFKVWGIVTYTIRKIR